ncbi:MAG TPA: thioesterase family protein [Mycobacteriales bacterium]|nr:thioesterase family protein [Mycobacteriales bacterium]
MVRRSDGSSYDVAIDPQWTIADKPNGGYLLALLGRAAVDTAAAEHPHPLAASAHYLRAPVPGPAQIVTELLRGGRSASQVRARLVQDGAACVEALVTGGRLDPAATPWWADAPPVALPPEADCFLLPAERPGFDYRVSILDVVDERLDPAVLGFAAGRPSGRAELRGWLRFADGHECDPIGLLFVADALPPATFELGTDGWVPTLELTAYVRAVPAPGALRVRQRARLVQGGLVDEVCEVWDSTGGLVATSTQLAGLRVSGEPARGR